MVRMTALARTGAVMVWSVILLSLASCSLGGHRGDSANAAEIQADSATVILSKYYSSRNYRNWLGRLNDSLGGPPIRFVQAYGMDSLGLESEIAKAGAIVLTGGEDIHPGRYGQPADTVRCGRIDVERDRVEHQLLDAVHDRGLPCLGVCRGLQVMNVHGGGTLHPHLPDAGFTMHRGGMPGDTRDTLHPVEVTQPWAGAGQNADTSGTVALVSHHHQGIDVLAPEFEAWAASPDGLTEGIRHIDTLRHPFFVGVQWHPERSEPGQSLTDGLGFALLRTMTAQR